jgi:uncharacterized protein (TIGR01777 family)
VLTRSPGPSESGVTQVLWDSRTLGPWTTELEAADAVVNLAGRHVNCRYHARNRRAIFDSRVESTRVLGEAIRRCRRPPPVWLNSSTATIYKHAYDRPMDEFTGAIGPHPEARDAFSVEVACAWEEAFTAAHTPATRKVALRTAMVFSSTGGGAYPVLRRLTRLGLGGTLGHGRQYVSWIHERDFCRAVEWLITHDDIAGPVNLAAPNPLPNREVIRLLRRSLGIPFGLPAARWMLELGAFLLRTETELVIKSRRVVPSRLLESGFEFHLPTLEAALADLTRHPARAVPSRDASLRGRQLTGE